MPGIYDQFNDDLNGRAFSDGGMMVMAVPAVLKTTVPVEAAALNSNTLQSGDRGFAAQRAGDRIVVNEVSVIDLAEKEGRPVVRLQSPGGRPVVGGDSGGGVWLNDRFTAVMWTTVMMENRAAGVQQTTDKSVAAVYLPSPPPPSPVVPSGGTLSMAPASRRLR